MTHERATRRHGVAGLYFVAGGFRAAQNMALTSLALVVHAQLHRGANTIGVLSAIGGIVLVLATLGISARLAPRHLEAAIAFGLVLLAASLLVVAGTSSLWMLLLAVVLLGVSGGLVMPSLAGAVQRAASQGSTNPERALAVYTLVLSISLAVGPLLEAGILDLARQDLRWPFLLFAFLPVAALALVAVRLRDAAALEASGPRPPRPPKVPLRELLTPGVRRAFLGQLMYSVPFAAVTVFGAEAARVDVHATASEAQLAFTVFFTVSLTARALVAWRSPIVRKGPLYLGSGILTALGVLLLAVSHSLVGFLVGMALLGIPHGLLFPISLASLADSLPEHALPRANSLLMGSTNVVGIAAPPILGVVAAASGYATMLLVVLVPVVPLLLALVATTPRVRALREPRP